jgi:hypothetical protein
LDSPHTTREESARGAVTGGGLDFEDTFFDCQQRHIESTSTEIEDQDVAFAGCLLVGTVGDRGGGGLVDDAENIKISDRASILGGLSLRIVEVSEDSNDCIGDGGSKVRLGGLPHLDDDHRGNFFGRKIDLGQQI